LATYPGVNGLLPVEKKIIISLEQFPSVIEQAAKEYNPSILAIYTYDLARTFSSFLTDHSVLSAESDDKKQLRLQLCTMTANIISSAMHLLGIRVPERM